MNIAMRLVRRICPLEEQEVARKIIADRLAIVRREVRELADAAMQVDDPELAVVLGFVGQEVASAHARAAR